PEDHPLSLRWLGMHGAAYANWAVSGEFAPRTSPTDPPVKVRDGADLLLAFGVRFDDRVTGKFDEFAKGATIVHVDIDPSEHNEDRRANLTVHGDLRDTLSRLNAMIERRGGIRRRFDKWHEQIAEWKKRAPFQYTTRDEIVDSDHIKPFARGGEQYILPQMVIEELHKLTNGEAFITTGVGQHQMWAAQ